MIGPWVVADAKQRVAVIQILGRHGPLADTNRLRHTNAGRFMTQVGAVGNGSVFPREQLIEKGRLIGCPSRGVKLSHVGVRQLTESSADLRKRLVP
jgi:hypothetical protein